MVRRCCFGLSRLWSVYHCRFFQRSRTRPQTGTSRDFGVTDERDIAWADPRIGDQSYRTLTQTIQLSAQMYESFPKTFIQLTELPWFVEAAERAKRQGFRYYQLLAGGHNAMISQPKAVSEILLDVARS